MDSNGQVCSGKLDHQLLEQYTMFVDAASTDDNLITDGSTNLYGEFYVLPVEELSTSTYASVNKSFNGSARVRLLAAPATTTCSNELHHQLNSSDNHSQALDAFHQSSNYENNKSPPTAQMMMIRPDSMSQVAYHQQPATTTTITRDINNAQQQQQQQPLQRSVLDAINFQTDV